MTEQSEKTVSQSGWVLYDAECSFCIGPAQRLARTLRRRQFELAPLQTPEFHARIGLADGERPKEMLVLLPSGTVVGGADAVVLLARRIWWGWPLFALSKCPGVLRLMRVCYRFVARNRHVLRPVFTSPCRTCGQARERIP